MPCRQPHALLVRSAGFLNQLLALGGPGAVLPQSGVTVPELRGDFSLNAGTSLNNNDGSRRVKTRRNWRPWRIVRGHGGRMGSYSLAVVAWTLGSPSHLSNLLPTPHHPLPTPHHPSPPHTSPPLPSPTLPYPTVTQRTSCPPACCWRPVSPASPPPTTSTLRRCFMRTTSITHAGSPTTLPHPSLLQCKIRPFCCADRAVGRPAGPGRRGAPGSHRAPAPRRLPHRGSALSAAPT